jgi:hypothetical protein
MKSMSRILAALFVLPICLCFTPNTEFSIGSSRNHPLFGKENEVEGTTKNPLELASWYAVEAFGKVFRNNKSVILDDKVNESIDFSKPPSSLEETLNRIQLDFGRSYFLSGEVDCFIYDEQCTFADPFVSFDGRDRFVDNLSNLGSFITNYDAKMIKFEVEDGGREIVTKVKKLFRVLLLQRRA